ncbi:hypothetical protein [Candidatus Nitrotoga sp. M5]|uniref:hypothetical protein n=1 Tax=Candidatus Nitrotoga sp. M5 TaxID=2890409 RepID=UPI001EF299AD|nr:hypothetical protein [Candidatus Nitrotoga sp. M5]CAH1386595.1 conserved exported hypothetical protein [Candidatus Nitrotoga sp. M5]
MNLSTAAYIVVALISLSALAGEPGFTKGAAEVIDPGLFDCGSKGRVSAVGDIQSEDGVNWIVPAETQFKTAPKAADLYNECAGVTPKNLSAVDISKVPVLDAGGSEEFVAYIFGDNYFEFHVNGKLLAVDAVPFTPFNASIVRFKANRPVTIAMKLVDWEENLGLGSENGRGYTFQPGDGGLVMHIQDAAGKTVALTDQSWRAQTFYIGPVKDRSCLKLNGNVRDSIECDVSGSNDGMSYSGAHWQMPGDWTASDFDDTNWPFASTYSNETVGVDNKPAYTNFTEVFDTSGADAQFIWSSNLILDNLVLVRKTIK